MNAPVITAPAPAPHTTAKPHQIADPVQAVVAALGAGYDPAKAVSELIELTGLKRGDVVSTIAALASADRVTRQISGLDDGALVVRWSLRR